MVYYIYTFVLLSNVSMYPEKDPTICFNHTAFFDDFLNIKHTIIEIEANKMRIYA